MGYSQITEEGTAGSDFVAAIPEDDVSMDTGAGHDHDGVNSKSVSVPATGVEVAELGTATYDDVQNYINFFGDRTLLSGGAISDNGNGTATVALGTAWAKATDADTAIGTFFDFSADASVALTDLTTNYIYLDYNAGTPQIVVSTAIVTHGFKQDHIHIGTIFRNGTTLHFHQEDNIGIGRVNIVDMYHLEKGDAERAKGLVTTDGGSLALSINAGVIYEGLSRHVTIVDGSTWSTWYTSDSGTSWTEVTGQSTINNTQYNAIASGLSTLTNNRFAVHWVYCDIDGENLHIIYGQGDYTAAQAEEAAVPSVLPNLVTNYGVLIAKIVVQKSDTTLVISYPWTSAFTSSLATDHGSLAGLTDDDHTQYQKTSEKGAANGYAPLDAGGLVDATDLPDAGAAAEGIVELATIAETDTGTDAGRVVTPDGLAGSVYGYRPYIIKVIDDATALGTGDGKFITVIPAFLNGWNLVAVEAHVTTVSSSGTPTYSIYNLTDTADMLSTDITIDINEYTSEEAATPPVINAATDDVATGDRIEINKDVAGTGEKGDEVVLVFQLP